jgi:hypothetical protein
MSTEENKAIVRRYVEKVLNEENLEVVDELFASDHVLQNPYLGEEKQGSAVMTALARLSHVISPNYQVRVEEMVAEGNIVMMSWTAGGQLADDMGDPGSTGDEVTESGISMFRFNNEGKISYTKELSRSLDDYPRLVPKEQAVRENLTNAARRLERSLGDDGEEVAIRLKCIRHPRQCMPIGPSTTET